MPTITVTIDAYTVIPVPGYVALCDALERYAAEKMRRVRAWMEWPGFWRAESRALQDGDIMLVEYPHFECDVLYKDGAPSEVLISQTDMYGKDMRAPMRVVLPLASDGTVIPEVLLASVPPHVAEDLRKELQEANRRMKAEVKSLQSWDIYVPFTEGKGEEVVSNGRISGMDHLRL